ncbi:hypothetical protein C1646_761319 [Rhizophagus diaphanus]|nr:hypothetical protein C1646_761319 [Rhizophagus diaphanus] [Rhizophagus sp. MUCL 43196]
MPIQMILNQKANQQAIQGSEIKLEPEKEVPVLELDLGNKLLEINDLNGYKTLIHDLEQYDPDVVHLPTLKELEEYEKSEIKNNKSSYYEASHQSKNLINNEFERLGEIKKHKKLEKNLEFREQEELEIAVKRRAIAIHHAKVLKFYLDNRSDI